MKGVGGWRKKWQGVELMWWEVQWRDSKTLNQSSGVLNPTRLIQSSKTLNQSCCSPEKRTAGRLKIASSDCCWIKTVQGRCNTENGRLSGVVWVWNYIMILLIVCELLIKQTRTVVNLYISQHLSLKPPLLHSSKMAWNSISGWNEVRISFVILVKRYRVVNKRKTNEAPNQLLM